MLTITDAVSARTNERVVRCASLSERKYREKYSQFAACGIKLVCEALSAGASVCGLFVLDEKLDVLLPQLESAAKAGENDVSVTPVTAGVLEKLTGEKAPDGACAVVMFPGGVRRVKADGEYISSLSGEKLIILSSVRDPGNMGTILRTACALSYDRVIAGADCADIFSARALRASMGAVFREKLDYADDTAALAGLLAASGRRVLAAEMRENSRDLRSLGIKKDDIFIIGNEGHGIDAKISSLCSGGVFIPISANAESLNASAAAAVLMWEQSR